MADKVVKTVEEEIARIGIICKELVAFVITSEFAMFTSEAHKSRAVLTT